MSKISKLSGFTTAQTKTETAMEKTARAVRDITEAETKARDDKTARLRKARQENNAGAR